MLTKLKTNLKKEDMDIRYFHLFPYYKLKESLIEGQGREAEGHSGQNAASIPHVLFLFSWPR